MVLNSEHASKSIMQLIEKNKPQIRAYKVKRLGLFGSFLKGKQHKRSDVDFLVSFEKSSFDNYFGLKFFLEKLFKKKVDLVIEDNLKPALKYVKKEALYVKGI